MPGNPTLAGTDGGPSRWPICSRPSGPERSGGGPDFFHALLAYNHDMRALVIGGVEFRPDIRSLALLYLLDHNGEYRNRMTAEALGDVNKVRGSSDVASADDAQPASLPSQATNGSGRRRLSYRPPAGDR